MFFNVTSFDYLPEDVIERNNQILGANNGADLIELRMIKRFEHDRPIVGLAEAEATEHDGAEGPVIILTWKKPHHSKCWFWHDRRHYCHGFCPDVTFNRDRLAALLYSPLSRCPFTVQRIHKMDGDTIPPTQLLKELRELYEKNRKNVKIATPGEDKQSVERILANMSPEKRKIMEKSLLGTRVPLTVPMSELMDKNPPKERLPGGPKLQEPKVGVETGNPAVGQPITEQANSPATNPALVKDDTAVDPKHEEAPVVEGEATDAEFRKMARDIIHDTPEVKTLLKAIKVKYKNGWAISPDYKKHIQPKVNAMVEEFKKEPATA